MSLDNLAIQQLEKRILNLEAVCLDKSVVRQPDADGHKDQGQTHDLIKCDHCPMLIATKKSNEQEAAVLDVRQIVERIKFVGKAMKAEHIHQDEISDISPEWYQELDSIAEALNAAAKKTATEYGDSVS